MRLTAILASPINYKHLYEASWTRFRRQKLVDDGFEAVLKEKGFEVVDANEFVKDLCPLETDYDALPDPVPLFPKPPQLNQSNQDWHDTPCKVFNGACFPVEGVAQAQRFSKSVQLKHGLPKSLLELGLSTKLKDDDELVKNAIRQAFLWDAVIEKLPKLMDLDIPSFCLSRKWGIPAERANDRLIRNLIRICELEYPKHAETKVVGGQHEFRVNLTRHDSLVQFRLPTLATILSRNLLKPIELDLDGTKSKQVPDIHPFNSIVNFEKEHIYKESDYLAFKAESPFPYVQTTFFSHTIPGSHTHIHPRWNNDRFNGSTILYCFATAVLMAKRKFGDNVKILPEPITTQAVHLTGKEFDFAVFQLNTLDLENIDTSAVKNMLWLTGKMNLFEFCGYNNGKGELIGYNPNVFKNVLAFYGNE